MSKFDWNNKYATNIHIIDEEHKFLFATLATLDGANTDPELDNESRDKLVYKILLDLKHYTATHFVVEEEMMRVYGYPDEGNHRLEHYKFVEKITYLISVFDESGFNIPGAMIQFLGDWLVNHIGEVDSKLGEFLAKQGQN